MNLHESRSSEITKAIGLETLSPAMAQISNYFNWVFEAMVPYLGPRVLEVGPGYGNLGERILQSARSYYAVDSDIHVINALNQKLGLTEKDAITGNIADPQVSQRIAAWQPDTLISMNVLEHIENDAEHLELLMRISSIRKLILFVPALPFLYGTLDRQAGHYRRYTRSGLEELLMNAGAQQIKIRYFNGLGAVTWWAAGRLFRCRTTSETTKTSIASYDRYIIPTARFLDPMLSRLLGQSLLAFADNRSIAYMQ